jgi:hypothetical protein
MKGGLALIPSDTIERTALLNRVFPYTLGRRRAVQNSISADACVGARAGVTAVRLERWFVGVH